MKKHVTYKDKQDAKIQAESIIVDKYIKMTSMMFKDSCRDK